MSGKRQFLFEELFLWKEAALQQHAGQTWFKIIGKIRDGDGSGIGRFGRKGYRGIGELKLMKINCDIGRD